MRCKMLRFNVANSSSFVAITKCGILKHCGIHGCPLTGTAQLRPKRILLPLVINVVKAIPENWFLTKATFLWGMYCLCCPIISSKDNSFLLRSEKKKTWRNGKVDAQSSEGDFAVFFNFKSLTYGGWSHSGCESN